MMRKRATPWAVSASTLVAVWLSSVTRRSARAAHSTQTPAKLITINTGDYHADIYFDRLEDMPLSNIRKVFKLLLADPWSNEGAIRQMTLYLDAAVIESKEAWKQASIEYQNGWRNVFNKKSRLKEDRQKLRENNRLTAAVKRSKARHERWVKLQTCWAEAQPDANTRV